MMPEFLQNVGWADVGVQTLGFLAMGLGVFSYQVRGRVGIILVQIGASVLWTTQFLLLGELTGALLNAAAIARGAVFAMGGRHAWARHPAVLVAFCISFCVLGMLGWQSWRDALAILGSIFSAAAIFSRDPQRLRRLALLASPPWLIYDACAGTIAGVCCEVFNIASILIALWRFRARPPVASAALAPSADENAPA